MIVFRIRVVEQVVYPTKVFDVIHAKNVDFVHPIHLYVKRTHSEQTLFTSELSEIHMHIHKTINEFEQHQFKIKLLSNFQHVKIGHLCIAC